MFQYNIEQKTYKVGKYNIGGDPRSTPTTMVGTIFYSKQKHIFKDETKGLIDKTFAEGLIKKEEELANKTGLVPALDVIISSLPCVKPILDFVKDATDMPIFLDAPTIDCKIPALQYVKEMGIQDRIVYNSITPDSHGEEYQMLKECGIKNYIVLAMESTKWTTQARMDVIASVVEKAKTVGLPGENFLVDGCVLDMCSLGLAMSAMEETKKKYGFPVGSGAHNAVDVWRNLKEKFGDIKSHASVVASTITLAAGADFLLYGPIQHADIMFPTAAFVKAAHSQLLFDEGKMAPPDHPVFKIG
ncbi:MAG: tetrahydromethanopterin S-methyltransferase subunit H [Promethearchaeota archaeon CR_4]|nr:MAG: tetrahydromethanopterin S-methyltransferase subunit H [Candidatus Lokiarchaeota archaeon CR_4]